jgi:phosphoribosylanthranilate isomerase
VLNGYSWERITENYVSLLKQLHHGEDKEFIKNLENEKRKHIFQEFAKHYTTNKNSTYKRDNWGKE